MSACRILFIYKIFTTVIKFSECFQYFMTTVFGLKGFLLSRDYGNIMDACKCNNYMYIFYFILGVNKCSIYVFIFVGYTGR